MISNEEIERLHAACLAMNAREIAVAKKKAEETRAAALQWPPFEHPEMEMYRLQSAELADALAGDVDVSALGLAYLLEVGILESLQNSAALALDACARHLLAAYNDPAVRENSAVLALLEYAFHELDGMEPRAEPSEVFSDMRRDAAKAGVSEHAAAKARSKNIDARAWVLTQWVARTDKGQSKASFARQHAELVKQRFGVSVLPDQIAREWLPKKPKAGP